MEKFERMNDKHKGGLIQFKVIKGNLKGTAGNYKSAWAQARLNCGSLYVFAENDEWGDTSDKNKLMKKKYVNFEYKCISSSDM